MLKNISCRQWRQSEVKRVNVLLFIGASVKQRIRESKKSYAKNVIHLMVDENHKLLKNPGLAVDLIPPLPPNVT